MKSKEFWIKLACWVGAVVDAVAALMFMFPGLNSMMTGLTDLQNNALFRNINANAVALMWGWTILLIWAAQKPMERRGVLFITLFPVLTWLIVERLTALINRQANPARNIPLLIVQVCIFALVAFSLWNSHKDRVVSHGK